MHTTKDTIHHTDGIGHHVDRAPRTVWAQNMGAAVEATDLLHGEQLVVDGLHTFTIGSTASAAIERDEDPVAAIDRARANGHELVWIYGNGSMIYAGPRMEPKPHVRVTYGMAVRFQGNVYTIEKAPNRNLRLQPMQPVAAVA